ncbi:hypothetical protein SDC9_81897 [bioreactor metagenome]|uniref:Uncharacterized protein n=1 Tax=bioreactor metagenome TaxID=1076179 RepID=A0A644Z3X3_9ZZZZ
MNREKREEEQRKREEEAQRQEEIRKRTTGDVINMYIRGKSLIKTSDDIYYIYNGHGDTVAWLIIKMKGGG